MINVEPGPWSPAPAPTMDEITFKSDTVLSDVHLYTPNQRHLMVRLNGMGQPVFLSQFKLLWNRDSGVKGGDVRTEETPPTDAGSPPGSGCHREDVSLQAKADTSGQEGLEAQLDEDGDLDVVRRPRAASDPSGPLRDKVHPMILTQEEDNGLGDEARESSPHDFIKIGRLPPAPIRPCLQPAMHPSVCGLSIPIFMVALSLLVSVPSRAHHGHPPGGCWQAGVAGCPAPGRLRPIPAGPLPGPHRAGAGRGHWARQHRRSHSGSDRLLHRAGKEEAGVAWDSGVLVRNPTVTAARESAGQPPFVLLLDDLGSNANVGADLLAMCQRNVALNSHLTAAGDPEVPFSWSEEDISDLYGHTTILLAAEVFYDDDLTDALFKTLSRLAHKLKNACTAILSVEKRLNFTLRHLDVTCEAYDHFRSCLRQLERLADGRLRFVVEPVDASFPQLLVYERIQQLAGVALHSGGSVRSRAPGGPSLRRATTSGRPPRSQPPRPLLLVRMPGSRWNLACVVPSPASIKGSFTQSRNQLLTRFSSHGARCPGKGRARCHSSGPFDPVAP
ncbi:methyltransferase-like protein 22 isoform X2 [Camelus ferus]|uniref:Methyltransferase-like protein 22 isoform X2 n=1 Tax=Camelus ferus TaxID=419612 RepID=A0A8B8RHP0_CAMFR|nr:methyltransferase-like protein 22 isoform X2 [Camelus ferus]